MMRIGAVFEWNNNIRYRVLNPLDALERRGHEIVFGRKEHRGRLDRAALARCDAIQVYRLIDPEDRRIVKGLFERGAALVWDTDDDLSEVPREAPYYARSGGLAALRDTHRTTLAMALEAQVVTTSTEPLAAKYRRAGVERVEALGNYLAPELVRIRNRKHDGIVVGWIAGSEHLADLPRVPIVEALQRLLADRPDVRVESIGVDLRLGSDRYRHIPSVPMDQFLEIARGWDIGLAVLSDIPFNRSRSDVKLKEYASLGIPWLASPVGPYAGMGERQGGRLVQDDGWSEALSRLTDHTFERFRLGRRARTWAKSQNIERLAEGWEGVFEEAVQRREQIALGRCGASGADDVPVDVSNGLR